MPMFRQWQNRVSKRIEKLAKKLEAEQPFGYWGGFANHAPPTVNDHVNYDVTEDTRPDFVKEDDAGWI